MFEDTEIIRLNIRHLQAALQVEGGDIRRQQIMKLLSEAKAQLALAIVARGSGRKQTSVPTLE